jgi:hypothetical protein
MFELNIWEMRIPVRHALWTLPTGKQAAELTPRGFWNLLFNGQDLL